MTDERQPYALARLVLDYLKAFAWPAIVLLVLLVYRQDLVSLVSEREFEAFGVKIGPRIEEVQENFEAELADIRDLLERQQAAPEDEREQITEDLNEKVAQLEENVSREVQQIRALDAPGARGVPAQRARSDAGLADPDVTRAEAQTLERQGFEALLARDADRALRSFDAAYQAWPDYHNVQEIRDMLRTAADRLRTGDDKAWTELYRRILTSYSWGMSKEHRAAMRERLY